jgi:hypothetical protein
VASALRTKSEALQHFEEQGLSEQLDLLRRLPIAEIAAHFMIEPKDVTYQWIELIRKTAISEPWKLRHFVTKQKNYPWENVAWRAVQRKLKISVDLSAWPGLPDKNRLRRRQLPILLTEAQKDSLPEQVVKTVDFANANLKYKSIALLLNIPRDVVYDHLRRARRVARLAA